MEYAVYDVTHSAIGRTKYNELNEISLMKRPQNILQESINGFGMDKENMGRIQTPAEVTGKTTCYLAAMPMKNYDISR